MQYFKIVNVLIQETAISSYLRICNNSSHWAPPQICLVFCTVNAKQSNPYVGSGPTLSVVGHLTCIKAWHPEVSQNFSWILSV